MADCGKRPGSPRIAYILKRFPRLSETFIAGELLSLSRRGFDVSVYSMKRPIEPLHPFVRDLHCPVTYLPAVSVENFFVFAGAHLSIFLRRPGDYIRCVLYAKKNRSREAKKKFLLAGFIARSILTRRVSHMHSHFATGSTRIAKYVHIMTGVPFSFTAHAKDIYSERVRSKQLKRRMRKARFVITISEFNRRYLEKIDSKTTIHVIRNGIPLDSFPMNGDRVKPGKTPTLLSVGRLVEKKGFLCLVEACSILKEQKLDFECFIVGDGPLREAISNTIEEKGLADRVQLAGARTQDELIEHYYRHATLFVLPCTIAEDRDMDGIPVVIEEAMAMGIPVISSLTSGIPELVRHEQTGMLVPPDEPWELSRTIRLLLENEHLREKIRLSARNLIEKEYDREKTTGRLAGLFAGDES